MYNYSNVNESIERVREPKGHTVKYSTGTIYTNIVSTVENKPYQVKIKSSFMLRHTVMSLPKDVQDEMLERFEDVSTLEIGVYPISISVMIAAATANESFEIINTEDIFEIATYLNDYIAHQMNTRDSIKSSVNYDRAVYETLNVLIINAQKFQGELKTCIRRIGNMAPSYKTKYPEHYVIDMFSAYR